MSGWYIKPNHSTRVPSVLATVGIATKRIGRQKDKPGHGRKVTAFMAYLCRVESGRFTRYCLIESTEPREVWRTLADMADERRPVWVYGWRLLEATVLTDFWQLVEDQYLRLWDCREPVPGRLDKVRKTSKRKDGFLLAEDVPFVAELLTAKGRMRLVDVRNYYDVTEEELYRSFDVSQPGIDEPDKDTLNDHFWAKSQALALHAIMTKTVSRWLASDQGVWKTTASGLAWSSFRHAHMRHQILAHQDKSVQDLEFAAYYGGKCQVKFAGEIVVPWADEKALTALRKKSSTPTISGPVYQIDARSFYPSVMLDHYYPTRLLHHREGDEVESVYRLLRVYCVVASVRIDSQTHHYPVRRDGRVSYRRGKFWTTLAGPELAEAIEAGDVATVGEHAVYSRAKLFDTFVRYWWAARCEAEARGDPAAVQLAKLVLRSLYGRFAMRSGLWIARPDIIPAEKWGTFPAVDRLTGCAIACRSIAGFCQQRVEFEESPAVGQPRAGGGATRPGVRPRFAAGAFVAIAAYVTSHARCRLDWICRQMPARSVLYLDTDGLLVTEEGFAHAQRQDWFDSCQCGGMRLLRSAADGSVVGPRCYRVGDVWTRAGLPDGAVLADDGGYVYSRPPSGAELLARRPDGFVWHVDGRFAFLSEGLGGAADDDGWLVDEPLIEE